MKKILILLSVFIGANSRRFAIQSNGKLSQVNSEFVNFGKTDKFMLLNPNEICNGLSDQGSCKRKLQYLKLNVRLGKINEGYARELMNKMVNLQKSQEKMMKVNKSNEKIREIVPEYEDEFRESSLPKIEKPIKPIQTRKSQPLQQNSTPKTKPKSKNYNNSNYTKRMIFYCFILNECSLGNLKKTPMMDKLQLKIEEKVNKIFPNQITLPKLPKLNF